MTAEVYPSPVSDPSGAESMLLAGHDVPLGRHTTVRRLLPHRRLRTVGPWCFVDAFGPDDVDARERRGMQIGPHPHTGLQTVTWLVEGEVVHRDSLGNKQIIAPGQLNLMTAGRGIAHSEQAAGSARRMQGLQLWLALPDAARHQPPRFEHHADLPVIKAGDTSVTVVVGELAERRSPAQVHSPVIGAEVRLVGTHSLPVRKDFEHAVLVLVGTASVAGIELAPGALLALPPGARTIELESENARLFVLGGVPFDEPLVMWWNFLARSHEEIGADPL